MSPMRGRARKMNTCTTSLGDAPAAFSVSMMPSIVWRTWPSRSFVRYLRICSRLCGWSWYTGSAVPPASQRILPVLILIAGENGMNTLLSWFGWWMISRWLPLCARAGAAAKASAPNAKAASAAEMRAGFLAFMANPPWVECLQPDRHASRKKTPRGDPRGVLGKMWRSVRERIRTNLDLVDLGPVLRAAFVVEHGARARHRPQAFAFPAGVRVVDAAVHELGVEAQRIRHTQVHHLAVHHRAPRLGAVGRGDRHVGPQSQGVVAIHPDVIGVVGAA